jgi:hypothetical protein
MWNNRRSDVENNVDRGCSEHRGRPERRLTDLKCWPEVLAKIKAGERSGAIAKWIREEARECLDIQQDSVRRMVARERETLGAGESMSEQRRAEKELNELRDKVEDIKNSDVSERGKRKKIVNVLEEAAELYALQMERLQTGRKVETTTGFLIKSLTSDVAEAREILKFMFEVQQETGMGKRPPPEGRDDKRFESLSYEARKRVLEALEMVKQKIRVAELEDMRLNRVSEEVVEAEVVRSDSPDKEVSPDRDECPDCESDSKGCPDREPDKKVS